MQSKNRKAAEDAESDEMTTEDRLAKLEKSLRIWRWLTLGLAGLLLPVAGGLGFLFFGVAPTLRARKFEIVSDKGVPVVILESVDSIGHIGTRNSEGRRLIAISSEATGDGLIETYSAKGTPMVHISTTPTGGAIRVLNNLGKEVVGLQSNKANCGLMMCKDVDGETRDYLSGNRRQ